MKASAMDVTVYSWSQLCKLNLSDCDCGIRLHNNGIFTLGAAKGEIY